MTGLSAPPPDLPVDLQMQQHAGGRRFLVRRTAGREKLKL